jgi:hypothetical protein
MRRDKSDEIGNHNQTKDEKSLPVETSLTREGSKAPSTTFRDEGIISAPRRLIVEGREHLFDPVG